MVLLLFSCSIMSDSLRPHQLQNARPPCPSPTPRVHSDSRPLSQWYHPAISSSVVPFSSCPQSLPTSKSFPMSHHGLPLVVQVVKTRPAMQATRVQSLGQKDPLEKGMATHCSIIAWRIPWTEKLGGLQSIGSQRVKHNWSNLTHKINVDFDCSHEIKRCLLLGRKAMTNLDSIFKSRDITLLTKVHLVKAMVFPVVIYGCES